MQQLINQMTKIEKWGTLLFIVSLLIVQFTTGSTVLGLATGVLGIFYVILVRLGSKWCYILGGIQMFLYVIIAYHSRIFGDVALNSVNIILQFIGWYNWSKREDNGVVEPKKLSKGAFSFVIAIWIIAWILGTVILIWRGGNTPYLDSFTTVTVMIAMILSINAYKEQWILFSASNFVEIVLWTFAMFRRDTNSITMMVMWTVYFLNGILGYKHWNDLYKKNIKK